MKILVFGAGVLGSYLAHALIRGGNDVTILARGKREAELRQDGLVIRHYFQRKTTVDEVKVIASLQPGDVYDLIFVVMKYNDFPAVLPILAENRSSHIVLVGNNADAQGMQNFLTEHSLVEKNVVFGFQLSGGLREKSGRVVCIRGGGQMVLGSLQGKIPFRPLLENAFKKAKYKLTYHEDMDAWLQNHIVLVVPLNAIHVIHGGDLKKIARDKVRLNKVISAMGEGFQVLEQSGYAITPASQANLIRKHSRLTYHGLKWYHRLPFAKWIDGSFGEISALYESFQDMKQRSKVPTPNWDELEQESYAKTRG